MITGSVSDIILRNNDQLYASVEISKGFDVRTFDVRFIQAVIFSIHFKIPLHISHRALELLENPIKKETPKENSPQELQENLKSMDLENLKKELERHKNKYRVITWYFYFLL